MVVLEWCLGVTGPILVRERERFLSCWFTPRLAAWPELGQSEAKSQELSQYTNPNDCFLNVYFLKFYLKGGKRKRERESSSVGMSPHQLGLD